MIRELNIDELLGVLHELDVKLPEPIVIRAVGFAPLVSTEHPSARSTPPSKRTCPTPTA